MMKNINKKMQVRLLLGEIVCEFDNSKDSVEDLLLITENIHHKGLAKFYWGKEGNSAEKPTNRQIYPLHAFFIDKKIIGYSAPFDLFGGGNRGIKKGEIVIKHKNVYHKIGLKPEEVDSFLPSEIVEPYFRPIYEEEKTIMIGEFEVEFIDKLKSVDCGIQIDKIRYYESHLDKLIYALSVPSITSIKWHNQDVTLETINLIIERLNK